MRKLYLTVLLIIAFTDFTYSQTLSSSVTDASVDFANIIMANPNSATLSPGDHRGSIWMDSDGKLKFRNATAYGYVFRDASNTVDQFTITGSGKVGIGVSNPSEKFQLKLDNEFALIQRSSNTNYAGHYYVTGPDNALDFNFFTGLREYSDSYTIYNGFLGQNAMTVDRNSNNVGIGTNDTHGYKLAVNGDIHTKKVVVDLINWPDYVFKPAYNLKPLSEVKSYIDLNHHLPEMPSEKEVAEKGVDLGEMNKLLVKKLEEVTLYMIEQQKQIEQLGVELKLQSKKLNKNSKGLNHPKILRPIL